jgi:myosin heavy subunit
MPQSSGVLVNGHKHGDGEQSLAHLHNYASFVYVHDEAYSWLPAKIISSDKENGTANVQVMKPADWTESTIFSSPQTPARFGGNKGPGGSKKVVKRSSFDTADHEDVKEIKFSDYPNGELPLQNISKVTKGDVVISVKPDMADLPFLHEASVLYNVKDLYCRPIHKSMPPEQQCVPYTRVGDIVIALNPFRWMDHLYSEKMQMLYADRLVWSPSAASHNEEHEASIPSSSGDNGGGATDNSKSLAASFFLKAGYQPHVYETSSLAYRALSLHAKNQTILVSGESGAGKTETVKIVMNHLAKIQSTKQDKLDEALHGSTSRIVERVLESNPLFEAFGNARTVRNDNSSRFGKFTSLIFQIVGGKNKSSSNSKMRNSRPNLLSSYERSASSRDEHDSIQSSKFSLLSGHTSLDDDDDTFSMDSSESHTASHSLEHMPYGILVGSTTETYLLEKTRVVAHGPNERTYHIFYQLLAASDDTKKEIWAEGLANTSFESFKFVGHNATHATEQTHSDDKEKFDNTVIDLSIFDIVGDGFVELMRALCIVMQLGNLTFGQPPDDDMDQDSSVVTSTEELEKLSRLMGVETATLESALVTRNMEARGESFAVSLNPSAAKDGCDALAKELYAQIFGYLVKIINNVTNVDEALLEEQKGLGQKTVQLAKISILDLFGFESFEVNRFEQVCINYANEKLQQKYVTDNFRLVQDEYMDEGIELFDLSKVDNVTILDLLEGRMGVIMTLNDECIRPNGSASSYVYKLKTIHRDNDLILSERLHRPEEFGIQHFAGPITYDATNFVECNNDAIPPDLVKMCSDQCTNTLVSRQFEELVQSTKKASKAARSARRSVSSNTKTVAAKFRVQLGELMKQIDKSRTRYIRCIRPNRDMAPGMLDQNSTIRQLASAGLVTAITISRETFPDRLEYETIMERFNVLVPSLKKTKLNLKIRVEEILEILMQGFGYDAMGSVKTPYALGKTKVYFRTGALEFIESKRENYYGARAVIIQTFVRARLVRLRFVQLRQGSIYIQTRMHATLAKRAYLSFRNAVIVLQSLFRRSVEMSEYQQLRRTNACLLIQTTYVLCCSKDRASLPFLVPYLSLTVLLSLFSPLFPSHNQSDTVVVRTECLWTNGELQRTLFNIGIDDQKTRPTSIRPWPNAFVMLERTWK